MNLKPLNDIDIRDCELKGLDLAKYANEKASRTQKWLIKDHPDRLLVRPDQYDDLADLFGADKTKKQGLMFITNLGYVMEVVQDA